MNFRVIPPPPQLADYVRFFWFAEGTASASAPYVHHAFAYPCPEFTFCYHGRFQHQAGNAGERSLTPGIYGQTQTFSKVSSTANFGVFGFYLYARHCRSYSVYLLMWSLTSTPI